MPRKTHPRSNPRSKKNRAKTRYTSRRDPREARTTVVKPIGRCALPTGKTKLMFATEEIAAEALTEARAHKMATGNTGRIEKRYYQCDICNTWHLTSLAEWVEREELADAS